MSASTSELSLRPFPDIPLDIARLIFETTALLDRRYAFELVMVSKLVRVWVDVVIYHTVILNTRASTSRFIYAIASRPSTALLIRSLSLWAGDGMGFSSSWSDTDRILSSCKNIVRLSCVTIDTTRLAKYLGDDGTLRPRYLSFSLGNTTPLEISILPARLTHLKLGYTKGLTVDWPSVFTRCPELSHVMFEYRDYKLMFDGQLDQFVSHVLAASNGALRRLVINFCPPPKYLLGAVMKAVGDVKDRRMVAISTDRSLFGAAQGVMFGEWRYPTDGQMDAWEVAEWTAAHRKPEPARSESPTREKCEW